MLPQSIGSPLAIFLAATLALAPIQSANAEPSPDCVRFLEVPASGQQALELIGDRIDEVALLNRRTSKEIRNLLTNSRAFHLDICGRGFFAETVVMAQESPLPSEIAPIGSALPAMPTSEKITFSIPKDLSFKLHSNPESKKVIYLDFDGETIENTQWNFSYNNGKTWTSLGFSQDGNFANFADSELQVIQSVWQRVSEDFAAFDVDVTTEFPGEDRITRSDESDEYFGTRVLISNDAVIFKNCRCSGLAYLGSFDLVGKFHKENQPAWVFTQGVGDNPKYIAESITHEVGHTLGLSHDGSNSASYYGGIDGWAPIMGVGFYQPITQWSRGEYAESDNDEDDYKIMEKHGLKLRADEDKNSIDTARKAEESFAYSGIIGSPSDIDYFRFTPNSSDNYVIRVEPASLSPNLDLSLTIYPKTNPIEKVTSNPPNVFISVDSAQGLSAQISKRLNTRTEYIIEIDGSAITSGKDLTTDYGSLGIYKLTIIRGKANDPLPVVQSPEINTLSSLANKLILPITSISGDPQKGFLPFEMELIFLPRHRNMHYAI